MAKIKGQLEGAQIENLTSDPTNLPEGREWLNTTTGKIKAVIGGAIKTMVTEDLTQPLTNKTMSGANNTFTNLPATGLTGTVPIVNGGTGASTPSVAINALLPTQTGNAGRYLTTDATSASWGAVVAGLNYTAQTTTYTAVISDYVNCTSGTFSVTLPTAVGQAGKSVYILNSGTGVITIVGFSGVKLSPLNESVQFISNGTNWMIAARNYSTASVAFTGTLDSSFGTVTNNNLRQYRQGEYLIIRGSFDTGTLAAGNPIITIPYNIDTTKFFSTAFKHSFGRAWRVIGDGNSHDLTSGNSPSASIEYVFTYNGTTNQIQIVRLVGSTTNGGTFISEATTASLTSNTTIVIERLEIPIQDWQ